jgi:hypothetical protein
MPISGFHILRDYLLRNRDDRSHIRLGPPRALIGSRWHRIQEVRPLGFSLELLCEGGRRLRLPRDLEYRRAAREVAARLTGTALRVLGPARVLRAQWGTDRRRLQRSGFLRLLLQQGGERIAVLAALPDVPPGDGARLLCSLVLWWDSLGSADRAAVMIPETWGDYLTETLRMIRIPLCCYSYTSGGRTRRIFPRDRSDSGTDSPYVMFPLNGASPEPFRTYAERFGELDLTFRSRRWELSYLGLPVLWLDREGEPRFDLRRPKRFDPDRPQAWVRHLSEVRRLRRFPPLEPGDFNYRFGRERWLESRILRNQRTICPDFAGPLYCQVPTCMGGERKVVDMLTVTNTGRLAVIELKPERDLELLYQGLEYWDRVRHHLRNGDFQRAGFFPGLKLSADVPLLFLVSPLFEFHRAMPVLRNYLQGGPRFHCIGINTDWRRELKVLRRFRI